MVRQFLFLCFFCCCCGFLISGRFSAVASVFLVCAWFLRCSDFSKSEFSGFSGGLRVWGLVLHRRLPVVRPKASRPKAEVPEGRHVRGRTSPKGDAPGGQTPRRETRPKADIPKGRHALRRIHARRRTIQKWILTLWQWFLAQRRALAPGRERCA